MNKTFYFFFRLVLVLSIAVYIQSCTNRTQVTEEQVVQDTIKKTYPAVEPYQKTQVENKKSTPSIFAQKAIARYAIAAIMGKPAKFMKVKETDGYYHVSYIRPSDKSKWDCRVKFEGNKIIWASLIDGNWGRWRDDAEDETITYSEQNKKLIITQTYSDGSESRKEYRKGE